MAVKPRCFTTSVTTAGTRVQLTSADIKTIAVLMQAKVANSGQIYIGDKAVSSTNAGIELGAGDSMTLSASEMGWKGQLMALNEIWLDTSNSGDGVWVSYFEVMK